MEVLRNYELRLLRCTLPLSPSDDSPSPQTQPTNHLYLLLNDLVASIESGNYLRPLSSEAARLIFDPPILRLENSVNSANDVYSELLSRVDLFLANDEDRGCRVIIVMCIAIAAFLAFTQCNMTGPVERLPRCPVQSEELKCEELDEWDNWARNQLMESGSHLFGKISYLQYLVFATMLLMRERDLLLEENLSTVFGVRSISWWLLRVTLMQQRILDERSSNLFDLLQVFTSEVVQDFGTLDKVSGYWGSMLCGEEASQIVSMAHLEAAAMEYNFGRVESCRSHLELAEAAAGLQLSVTGVLGFRTVHQVEPKPQMILVSNTCLQNNGVSSSSVRSNIQDSDMVEDSSSLPQHVAKSSDVMITPKLLENNNEFQGETQNIQISASNATLLKGIQQTVILAQCLLIEKSTRQDEMQRWDMAPYIEAIDSQQSSYFVIRFFCDILRIRWEATRNRTRERALLMMEKLVHSITQPSPEAAQRILFCYGVCIPTIPALRKEYGEYLVRFGLIGEAVKVFEDLELWDSLIFCYRLLEKKAAAVDLIKKRLGETPNDPRLWCSLGDVTNDDSCYEKALEVSNNGSARAKRSLARSAYNRGDYETSRILWESALALNSMYPDGWFALGAAALKARNIDKALDGFTRAVQLDPENGEAWNNIACLHMIKKKNKEAFIAFREALKFKRNSWQMWENYSHVALDVGNIGQAMEATQMVLELSSNKRIDVELLERIILEIETRERKNGESRETEHLVELLGKTLQQIVKHGAGGDVWGLYSRWHRMKGDLTMCSEALLKQVRSYQGSDLWKDRDRFKKFAFASLELCKLYMEISISTKSCRELYTAEMHLKNVIKQAESFSDTDEYWDLQNCLNEVKTRLKSE